MKINVKSKGTQPTCQMPFVLSCEHWFFSQTGVKTRENDGSPS